MNRSPLRISLLKNVAVGLLFIPCLSCTGGDEEIIMPPPERAGVKLTEVMSLGEDLASPAEYLFGHPVAIRTDQNGYIYIADTASMNIRVYDGDGTYLKKIGTRGRGPGEILDITCFDLDGDDELIVADGQNFRITRFSVAGEALGIYPIEYEEMLWPRHLRQLGPDRYLFLYKMPVEKKLRDTRYLFHLYDGGFNRKRLAFGAVKEVLADVKPIADLYLQYHPGSLWIEENGSILYAPSLYHGEIFRYERRGERFQQTATYAGYVAAREPLVEVDAERYTAEEVHFRLRSRQDLYAGILKSESRGLFRLSDGRLVHFNVLDAEGDKVFGVELFAADGTLTGYEPLVRVAQAPDHATELPLYVDWKDQHDRFYLRDLRNDAAVVRVVRLDHAPPQTAAADGAGDPAQAAGGVVG